MNKLLTQKIWTGEAPCHFEFRNPQPPFPLHTHDFHEIAVIYNGKGEHITKQGISQLEAGDIISIKPGQIHGYNNINGLVLMNILIKSSFFTEDFTKLSSVPGYADLFHFSRRMQPEEQPVCSFKLNKLQLSEVRTHIAAIQEEITGQNLSWPLVTTAYLAELIILLLRIYNNPGYPDVKNKNNTSALIQFVEKNYRKNLTMNDLTDFFSMSESTILRTFKHSTGYSPFEFQMRQRIFAAINELVSTERDITQIAYDMGFNDSNYFSRCFKKFTNLTPTEYRKQFTATGKSKAPQLSEILPVHSE
jgi:AraC-like DNA-binding protein